MKLKSKTAAVAAALGAWIGLGAALAAEDGWEGGYEVKKVENGLASPIEFVPLAKADKKWKICAVVPHFKDSYWLSVNFGLVEEAKRLGVALTIYQAGGYANLPKQVNQFDDCLASGADAILAAPISEAGLSQQFAKAAEAKIPVVAFVNPILESPVTTKIFLDNRDKGYVAGEYLRKTLADKEAGVLAFPGPQGSGWAEASLAGFEKGLEGSKAKVLDSKFGETGVSEQLPLVQDALQSFPDAQIIWGTAPTVEAAQSAIVDAGRDDIQVIGAYEDQTMLRLLKEGKIMGFVADYTVMQSRIALDLAVMALEGKAVDKFYTIGPVMVSKESMEKLDVDQLLSPTGWQPIFSVE